MLARGWFKVKQSAEAERRGSEEDAEGHTLNDWENPPEDDQAHEKAGHGETVAAQPVEVTLRAILGHEDHDASAAIQWRNRKEIEGAEEKIQGKENEEDDRNKTGFAGDRIVREKMVGTPDAQSHGGNDHQREVGGRAGQGHPGRAARMPAFPERVIRGTGPTDHAAGEKETENRENDHAKGRPADVRDGIEGDLASEGRGGVSSEFGDEGVGRFVAGGGEKKSNIPDKAERKSFGREVWHKELG